MATNFAVEWDKNGERYFEAGLDRGMMYPYVNGKYENGVAWSGLTKVDEKPTGGDANEMWADNIKYAEIRGAEKFEAGIEAYMYPDEFAECDGSVEIAPGVMAGQQTRKPFGFSYRTQIGNDEKGLDAGYKIHFVYNARVSPSEKSRETINDSPDGSTMSWDLTTTPVNIPGYKASAHLEFDTRKIAAEKLAELEEIIYGKAATDSEDAVAPRMPLPEEIITLLSGTSSSTTNP